MVPAALAQQVGDYNAQLKRLDQSCKKYEEAEKQDQAADVKYPGSDYSLATQKHKFEAADEVIAASKVVKPIFDAISSTPDLLRYYRKGAFIDSRLTLENFGLFADYVFLERITN